MSQKYNFLGLFQAMWNIRIHATFKIDMERKCHICVTNAFEIWDVFVRIFTNLVALTYNYFNKQYNNIW